jgi:hypothetical protein
VKKNNKEKKKNESGVVCVLAVTFYAIATVIALAFLVSTLQNAFICVGIT